MSSALIEEFIIPGFHRLSEEAREKFKTTTFSGKQFDELVDRTVEQYNQLQNSAGLWSIISGSLEEKKKQIYDKLVRDTKKLIENIQTTDEYLALKKDIATEVLQVEFSNFNLLEKDQQQLLCSTELVQKLVVQLESIDQSIQKKSSEQLHLATGSHIAYRHLSSAIESLHATRKALVDEWYNVFSTEPEFDSLRKTIEKKSAIKKLKDINKRAVELATFFPILNFRKTFLEHPIIIQLRNKYLTEEWTKDKHPSTMIDDLSDFFFHYMKLINLFEIKFIDLDPFNKEQAHHMAEVVLKAFREQANFNFNALFDDYAANLYQHLQNELLLIHGKRMDKPKTNQKKELLNSLSFLWSNPLVDKTNKFVGKLGDAHAFMQATNFSSQNESSFLAILDIYNYARFHESISETKTIIASLFSPFNPIFQEYKDIGLYEHNVFWKYLRILVPIIIVVASIILITSFLTPLALPELVFIAAFIPELFIGLGVATIYVSVKNDIYKFLRETYYDGAYEIPEFQINARMIEALGNEKNALSVRAFYLDELKICDSIEAEYQLKSEQSTLTQHEIADRKTNTIRRHQLCLEWYDIHSNKELGWDQIPQIVLNTLQQKINDEYTQLESTLKADLPSIRSSVDKVTADLKNPLIQFNRQPNELDQKDEHNVIETHYTPGLFKQPKCLKLNFHIEDMVSLSDTITNIRPT